MTSSLALLRRMLIALALPLSSAVVAATAATAAGDDDVDDIDGVSTPVDCRC